MDKTEPILQEIKNAVIGVDPTAEVILFGSRARGDFHPESDWDLLVLVDKEQEDFKFKDRIRDVLYDVELKAGNVISTVVCNKQFWKYKISGTPIFIEVAKDGVQL